MATRPPVSLPKLSRRSKILLIIAAVVVLALLLGARLLDTYIDWLWFGEVAARDVFSTIVLTRIVLFLVTGLLVGGLLAISLAIAYRTRPVFVPVSGTDDPLARYRSVVVGRIRWFGIGIPVIVGLIAGATGQGDWKLIQLFLHGTEFGRTDPEFGNDIGFYAFDLPFYGWLLGWLFVGLVVAFVGGLLAHYLFGGIRLAGKGGQIAGPARVHLLITVGIFVVLKAVEYFFDRYNLLLSDRNELFTGATYTDLNAVLPAKLILLCISVFCAIAFFVGAFLRNMQLPVIALVLLLLSGILIGLAWPAILQQFSVRPNENQKEATSIQRNMDATRHAFNIDDVDYQNYAGKSEASPAEVTGDQGTVPNIRLLDPNILNPTFTQRSAKENFYGFSEKLDIDRYEVNGQRQEYIVAAKEINTNGLAANQRSWINRHLVYTHGNGFVTAPANKIDRPVEGSDGEGGYPVATTSDTQNPNPDGGVRVDEPRIYYGELATDYAIAGGQPGETPGEYDTAADRSYLYQGDGGVPIDNWFNRLAFAAHHGERNILFSDQISDNSKIMYNRDPRDRVSKIAPWLNLDGDPYPAVINGRIKWIVDGYTTLNNYPYAQQTNLGEATRDSLPGVANQPNNFVNYMRNSVKATVDAFSGKVEMYSMNDKEPVLRAWQNVFPGKVKPKSEIPQELRKHLRYPEEMFKVQRELISKYHVQTPQEFFSTQTFWNVPPDPTEEGGVDPQGNGAKQPAYYLFAQAPGQNRPNFQITSSLTPLERQYLAAWMSVSSDPPNYGKIKVLRLPTGRNQNDGPVQVQNRFQSNPEYAGQRTLLGNQSVDVINGNLLTLPVAEGFLYVEPIYIRQRNQNSYPQLARILVSYGGRVGFASTLSGALDQVFGEGTGESVNERNQPPSQQPPPTEGQEAPNQPQGDGSSSPEMQQAVSDIQSALEDLKSAQQSGDFPGQGRALQRLDEAAQRYDQAQQAGGQPATPADRPGG